MTAGTGRISVKHHYIHDRSKNLPLHHNMELIVPGRLERVNAWQGAQDATSKIRWSGFCSNEFSVDKVLIVGRCRRFPSVGLLMETWEDDKVHNNLALTSAIMYHTEGQWVIVQMRKFALYHRLQSCQMPVQGRPVPPLYCPKKVPKALVEAIRRINSNTMMCMHMWCSS